MALADNRKAALSVNTNMGHYGGGPTSALSNAEAPSLNSLSATDTDSHTHAIVLAGGQSHHHAGHSQNSGLAPNACVAYQRIQCPLSTKDCTNHHVCIRCNGPHPSSCVRRIGTFVSSGIWRNVLLRATGEHRCLRCASKEHTLRVCPIRPLGGAEFCFAWNSAGTCRIMDCRRLHECIRCGTSHPSIICPENLDNYLIEYIKRRRGEGVPEDDLQRLEAQINSSLPQNGPSSHPNQASMSVSLAGLAPSNNQLPQLHNQYSSSSLNQTHPMHIAAVAAASASMRPMQQQQQHQQQQQQQQQYGGQGNIGIGSVGASGQYAALLQQQQQYSNQGNMNVHAPHQSPNMMAGNLMMSPMDERQTKRLRGDDQHSMYGVGLSGGNTMMQMGGQMVNQMTQGYGRQQNMPGVQNMYQQQQFGYNPQLIGGLVGQTAGTGGGSFLAEGDRKTICRDYNNFKCESEDGRCRFRHVCLRCGAHDHRERIAVSLSHLIDERTFNRILHLIPALCSSQFHSRARIHNILPSLLFDSFYPLFCFIPLYPFPLYRSLSFFFLVLGSYIV
ncbi:hypothetical protein BC829DRAFT_268407 [Chytridium lagenaria]|nr:hypothetical protein BC829DRAFT_268407 [Chytridium lagenaria]